MRGRRNLVKGYYTTANLSFSFIHTLCERRSGINQAILNLPTPKPKFRHSQLRCGMPNTIFKERNDEFRLNEEKQHQYLKQKFPHKEKRNPHTIFRLEGSRYGVHWVVRSVVSPRWSPPLSSNCVKHCNWDASPHPGSERGLFPHVPLLLADIILHDCPRG